MKIFNTPRWYGNEFFWVGWSALLLMCIGLSMSGCTTTGPKPGGQVIDTACNIARAELARCDQGAELDAKRCRQAADAVFVCAIGNRQPENTLLASNLRPGVGLTPRSTQTCWREFVGGQQKFGIGRLDIDPWTVAGMPGGGQGGLPCGIEAVNLAYKEAFGQPCLGPGAPLGGYCGGPSNEILRGAPPLLEWACRNRPDLIGSEGSSVWNCSPGGLDLLRLAAFAGGNQMLAAVRAAMPQDPPPASFCGDHTRDPGENCTNCPEDIGTCPPPPPPPVVVPCAPPLVCGPPNTTVIGPGLSQPQRDELRRVCGWGRMTEKQLVRCRWITETAINLDAKRVTDLAGVTFGDATPSWNPTRQWSLLETQEWADRVDGELSARADEGGSVIDPVGETEWK